MKVMLSNGAVIDTKTDEIAQELIEHGAVEVKEKAPKRKETKKD